MQSVGTASRVECWGDSGDDDLITLGDSAYVPWARPSRESGEGLAGRNSVVIRRCGALGSAVGVVYVSCSCHDGESEFRLLLGRVGASTVGGRHRGQSVPL